MGAWPCAPARGKGLLGQLHGRLAEATPRAADTLRGGLGLPSRCGAWWGGAGAGSDCRQSPLCRDPRPPKPSGPAPPHSPSLSKEACAGSLLWETLGQHSLPQMCAESAVYHVLSSFTCLHWPKTGRALSWAPGETDPRCPLLPQELDSEQMVTQYLVHL